MYPLRLCVSALQRYPKKSRHEKAIFVRAPTEESPKEIVLTLLFVGIDTVGVEREDAQDVAAQSILTARQRKVGDAQNTLAFHVGVRSERPDAGVGKRELVGLHGILVRFFLPMEFTVEDGGDRPLGAGDGIVRQCPMMVNRPDDVRLA